MTRATRRVRDPELLDAIDALVRKPFSGRVWRVVREGRDPALGSPSHSRWCNGAFDALYTAMERDGAIAEVHALLALQPVFPSGIRWFVHELAVPAHATLTLADFGVLQRLGVDPGRYRERAYGRTQEIADAAHFLGFDGLIAPGARWRCYNFVLFTEHLAPDAIAAIGPPALVSWECWRRDRAERG